MRKNLISAAAAAGALLATAAYADFYLGDDTVINGGICSGSGFCDDEDGEVWHNGNHTGGSGELKLKYFYPMITFDDVSDDPLANRDWQLRMNNGWPAFNVEGDDIEQFEIVDLTANTIPFRILGPAPDDGLVMTSAGLVGLGIAAPATALHVWGVSDSGGAANTTQVRVENADDTTRARRMIEIVNNGQPQMVYTDSSLGRSWQVNPKNNSFVIQRVAYGGEALAISEAGQLTLRNGAAAAHLVASSSGNLTITGTLTQGSDVNSKRDIAPLDGASVLTRLDALPVSEWTYKADASGARHAGPMAQDFHAAFGYGDDPTHLAPGDVAGVALAAVKELREENAALRARLDGMAQVAADNAALRAQMALLLERVSRIEAQGAVASR